MLLKYLICIIWNNEYVRNTKDYELYIDGLSFKRVWLLICNVNVTLPREDNETLK